jgi:carboxyl-terminal processing protease
VHKKGIQQADVEDKNNRGMLRKAGKIAALVIVIGLVFYMGLGIGSGSFSFRQATSQNAGLPENLNYASIEHVYDLLKADYDGKLTEDQLLDGIKTGLAQATGDPYTVYLNDKDTKEFNDQLQGTFSGIGAELGKDAQANLIIVAPIDGTPASRAGIRPQDIIASINGKTTTGISIDEAVSKIRGPKGTKVKLDIIRDKSQTISVTIERDNIKVPSVKHEILDDNVGYLQITQFNGDTVTLASEAAQEFKSKGVKGVVLDLRGNPGGHLDAAVAVSSLWLPQGKVVLQEKQGKTVVDTKVANGDNPLLGIPTAVLINAGSASASEITAGALMDNKVATLFGVKSYGKGSVQQLEPLAHGGELKVTIARWYRPNGQNIDKKGISPDKEVKMTDDDYKNQRDPQKDAAINFIKSSH